MNKDDPKLTKLLSEIAHHKPWEYAPEVWANDVAYWTWLRGKLRQLWCDYPVRNILKESLTTYTPILNKDGSVARFKTGKKKGKIRYASAIPCSLCGNTFSKTSIEMDHLDSAGSCKDGLDACIFLFRLLCPPDRMRPVCKPCHKIHTYSEARGIPFEEAVLEKKVIAFSKLPIAEQLVVIDTKGIIPKSRTKAQCKVSYREYLQSNK